MRFAAPFGRIIHYCDVSSQCVGVLVLFPCFLCVFELIISYKQDLQY